MTHQNTSARRQREALNRKQAILDAAWDCFLTKGIAGTSMDDIARSCELAKGTLYLYFSSKDEIAFALLLQATERLLQALHQSLDHSLPAVEQIKCLAVAYCRFFSAQPESFRYMFVIPHDPYSGRVSDELLDSWGSTGKAALSLLSGLIAQGVLEGDLKVEDPWSTAVAFWSAVTGIIVIPSQEVRRPFIGELDVESLVTHAVEVFLKGLRPDAGH